MENDVKRICPFCKKEIKDGEPIKVCPACGTPHHESCWKENQGCAVNGCNGQRTDRVHICSNCSAPIPDDYLFCVNCGAKNDFVVANANDDQNFNAKYNQPKADSHGTKAKAVLKKHAKGISISAAVLAVVLVLALYVFPQFIMPQINLSLAKSAFEKEDYIGAYKHYEKSGFQNESENINQYTYCEGIVAYNDKDYATAILKLEAVKSEFESASNLLPKVYYEYGLSFFTKRQYSTASGYFEKAGDYSDAKKYVNGCSLMNAEELLSTGHFNEAKQIYKKLPKDFSFNDISVSKRLNNINNASAFGAISGKWVATKNNVESRNIYKATGSWEAWSINGIETDQTLEIFCHLNSDGTVTIKGSVSFYRYTNYSSLSAYCQPTLTTKSFIISNIRSIPASYRIDSNTILKYANGKFSISYSVTDNYSMYFYNLYSSAVTYGKRIKSY